MVERNIKKSKKASHQSPRKNSHLLNVFYLSLVGLLTAAGLLGLGWFLGHQEENYNPYQALKGYESSRHGFIVKSAEVSVNKANRAIQALKKRNIKEAIADCKIAIDIFPIDAKPYILLTKLYLMTGQEQKMYETLTLSGQSYPNFDNIVSVSLMMRTWTKIPLEETAGKYLSGKFPGK